VRSIHQLARRVVRLWFAPRTDHLEPTEVMLPAKCMPRGFTIGQTVMHDADPRSVAFWCEGDFKCAGARWQFPRSATSPRDDEPTRTRHLHVPALYAAIVEKQRELTPRPRIEDGPIAHPANERLRLREVVEYLFRIGLDVDRIAIRLSAHGATPPP